MHVRKPTLHFTCIRWPFSKPRLRLQTQLRLAWPRGCYENCAYVLKASDERTESEPNPNGIQTPKWKSMNELMNEWVTSQVQNSSNIEVNEKLSLVESCAYTRARYLFV